MSVNGSEGGRDRWSSRLAFVLGAVGSAVGLGNLWRFPAKAYANGGAAFLLPYACAFFIFGIPLLFLELLLGRHFQGGDPVCFGGIDRRLKGVGWTSVFNSFMIASYYNVIIAYSILFFWGSWSSPLPWANAPENVYLDADGVEQNMSASTFFYTDTLMISSSFAVQNTANLWLVAALAFTWVCVFLSIYKGVEVVSKVVLVSVPLPIVLLVVILVNNISKDGAQDGVTAYLGVPEWDLLASPQIWQEAIGQIFFSIGVCFGVMTAYSSYRDPEESVLVDTFSIAGFNSFMSIFAGFVVFTSLGIYGEQIGQPLIIDGEKNPDFPAAVGGPSLVFVTYPAALSEFEGIQGNIMAVLFFAVIFFLALDSAFSIVEAVTTAIHDSEIGKVISRESITLYTCVVCFSVSIFYALDNGLYLLDAIDKYVNDYGMLLLGAFEAIAAGWVFKYGEQEASHGAASTKYYVWGYWGPVFVAICMFVFLPDNWIYLGLLAVPAILIFWFLGYQQCSQEISFVQWLYDMTFYGVSTFVDLMKAVELKGEPSSGYTTFVQYFSNAWAVNIVYVIPTISMFLVIRGAVNDVTGGHDTATGTYEGYENSLLNIGRYLLVIGAFIEIFFYVMETAYMKAAEQEGVEDYRVSAKLEEAVVAEEK